MKAITIIFGVICGAFVGFALGIVFAAALGYWSKWSHPEDPSAFSVAIVGIATAPLGAIAGAVLGGVIITSRPRLFLATILPLAVLFLGWYVTLSTLQEMDRPRTYVLEVNGTRGAQYFGVLTVDGATQRVNGAIPATFEFEAYRIDLAFALVRSKPDDNIAVKVLADGRDLKLGTKSQTGVSQQLRSYGYSETFGGTNASWHRMTIEEVDRLIKNQVMPRGMLLEP